MHETMATKESKARPAPSVARPLELLVLDSRQLFAGRYRVHIRHGDETYVLRLTRQGKLILTK